MRGNVNTRLAKLDEHHEGIDALVLAVAGLHRVDQAHRIGQILDVDLMAPPVGAGIIVVQTRANDPRTKTLLAALNDPATEAAAIAERTMLARCRTLQQPYHWSRRHFATAISRCAGPSTPTTAAGGSRPWQPDRRQRRSTSAIPRAPVYLT